MAKSLQKEVQEAVKKSAHRKADIHSYLHKSRNENGVFMDNLIKDPEVGGVLEKHMKKAEIKTYIKDSILNRYSKDKALEALARDTEAAIRIARKVFRQESIEIDKQPAKMLFLLRLENGDILLVAQGTLLKWETALRKALEFITKSPGLPPPDNTKLHILLNIAVLGKPFTNADRTHLQSTLAHIGVMLHLADMA